MYVGRPCGPRLRVHVNGDLEVLLNGTLIVSCSPRNDTNRVTRSHPSLKLRSRGAAHEQIRDRRDRVLYIARIADNAI